jgi:hypothetical protein
MCHSHMLVFLGENHDSDLFVLFAMFHKAAVAKDLKQEWR